MQSINFLLCSYVDKKSRKNVTAQLRVMWFSKTNMYKKRKDQKHTKKTSNQNSSFATKKC